MNNKYTDYQRNWERSLKRAKEYYESNKEKFQEEARNKYRELSNIKKDIWIKYRRNIYIKICLDKISKNWKNIKINMVRKIHLNILLDVEVTLLLYHYA